MEVECPIFFLAFRVFEVLIGSDEYVFIVKH